MEETCVLIPSYNEARTIGAIVKALRSRGLAAYVVDDGSSDRTAEIAAREGAVVMRHDRNKGKGASLREGFKRILEDGFGAVLVMDGDGQHSVDDIDAFFTAMRQTGADMVVGNRMGDTTSMPHSRIATNRFMSYVISKMAGQAVPDTQCGFRLVKRSVLENTDLGTSNYEIESELIVAPARKGFKIASVPIKTVYGSEESRINPVIDTLRFVIFVARHLWKR
jgi:glycosyltransferase involved in cell wall biosynthesis